MDIRPIRNDADHEAALRTIERLWDAPEGSREVDVVEVLATLVDLYENSRWPTAAPDPVAILNHAIAALGRSQAELAEILGSKSRASEILNRRRALSSEMIDRISRAWGIPTSVLAVPYALALVAKAPARAIASQKFATRKKPASKPKATKAA